MINSLIAGTGGKIYETLRKGFYQRPEERQANRLAQLKMQQTEYDLESQKKADALAGRKQDMSEQEAFQEIMHKGALYVKEGTPEQKEERSREVYQTIKKIGFPVGEYTPYSKEAVDRVIGMFGGEETSKFGKITPSQYTPASIAKFQQTKDYADLIAAPSKRQEIVTGTPAQWEATKKITGKAQEKILDAETMLDSLYELNQVITRSPNIQTVWGDMASGILKLGARLGIKSTGSFADFRKDKQNIINYTRKVQDAYRRIITGSQANKYELKRIETQMPNENDDIQTLKNKMNVWQEEIERVNVRHRLVLKKGFKYVGKDTDGNPLYRDAQGNEMEISLIESLGNIPSHKEARDKLSAEIEKRYPGMDEKQQMKAVINEMAKMGYDIRRYRGL